MMGISQKITAQLKKHLLESAYQPGHQLPTERTLMIDYHVSRTTIRKCLKNLVNENLLIAKPGSGYFLPTEKDRRGDNKLNSTIIFLHENSQEDLSDLNDMTFFWKGAREICLENGKKSKIKRMHRTQFSDQHIDKISKTAEGIISDCCDQRIIAGFKMKGIPVVQIYSSMLELNVDSIIQDDIEGMRQGTEYLYKKGHRKIAYLDFSSRYISKGISPYNMDRRKLGYILACEQLDIATPSLILKAGVDIKEEFLWIDLLAASGATALIAPQFVNYSPFKKKLKKACLQPFAHTATKASIDSNHFGFVNWGTSREIKNNSKAHYTYINWDKAQMGKEGVTRLLERIKKPDMLPVTIHIPTFMVEGKSGGIGPAIS